MRSLIQLRQRNEQLRGNVANLASGVKDKIKVISAYAAPEVLTREFKEHRDHIEKWIDPRMRAIMQEYGGAHKDMEAGKITLIKAGRENRPELWSKYFNQFPTVICKHVFAMTADVLPFEYMWACDNPDETVIAYRKALEYIFREICEDSFLFCSFQEKESKGNESPIRKSRTESFKNMCYTQEYRDLGLPKNPRDYLVKDPATWRTTRAKEVNKTNGGGPGGKRPNEASLFNKSKRSKR